MDNRTLLDLIAARSDENSIRDIINTLEIDGGLIRGNVYFIVFETLDAVYRRVYNQVSPETKELDFPISVRSTTKENFNLPHEWAKKGVSKMENDKHVAIFICTFGGGDAFAPIMIGIFNM